MTHPALPADGGALALHATLARQLRRLRLDPAQPPPAEAWRELLHGVDRAYHEADELVYLVTHSERIVTDELERSQQALSLAQRIAGLGSWSYDVAVGRITISDELAYLLELDAGRRPSAVDALIDLVAPDDRDTVRSMLATALSAAAQPADEVRFVTSGGRVCWCLCRMAGHVGEDGHVNRVDGTVLDISDRHAVEERTRELARTDPLTGLVNRAHFIHLLVGGIEAARSANAGAAVVFIDLDGFKNVNDTCGHHVGDALLESVARRLRACLRASDVVGRFGGDEFVVLLPGVASVADVTAVTDKVLRACANSILHAGEKVAVSASVGVALFPADGETAEQLLKHADAAMYVAKESGRNNARFFGAEARARRQVDRSLVASLRTAIARDRIGVAYQPIVEGGVGRIVGVEALARWVHPDFGPIAPTDFVALAEDNGLIGRLCQRVSIAACRELMALPEALRKTRYVSINVSPVQLRTPNFVSLAERMLAQTGIDPHLLAIEITETAVLHDMELAVRMLTEIKALGVSIWLDDFGTGHSSLTALRRLPIDCIKIDRSFVSDIAGDGVGPLLQGIVAMARSVGCEVLAEGVETELQRQALLDAGCSLMQGLLFGGPDAFARWTPMAALTA